jgi:hypothetical protein
MNTCFRGRAGGMGDGFSRTGAEIGGDIRAAGTGGTGTGDAAACLGASRFTTSRVGTSCGFTAKYTIPDASTAPVAKAVASFQFTITQQPPRLLR